MLQDLETGVHSSLLCSPRNARPFGSEESGAAGSVMATLSDFETLRVLIADDVPPTRRFLRAVLEHCQQFDVVGEASDGDATVMLAESLQPDVVLLDLSMPLVEGSSALDGIHDVAPGATVIVVSGMNPELGIPVLEAGAVAFVPKGIPPFELLDRLGNILDRPLVVECREPWKAILDEHRAVVCVANPTTRHLVTRVLERCGVIVEADTHGESTMLRVVNVAQPEIVVLDLCFDDILKPAVISEIYTRSPLSLVIVCSAFELLKEKALAAGATAFVPEARVNELGRVIRQLAPIG